MFRPSRLTIILALALFLLAAATTAVYAWDPHPVREDPLIRMPGTQPEQGVDLPDSGQCLNCHEDFDAQSEPGNLWQGSMMGHAARDFLYWATMTVAAQDAVWAVGNPNATDICLRCHLPRGWLAGRSDEPNGSLMSDADYDGVQCTVCHYMYDPFYKTTFDGTREGSDWDGYWDETNLSDTPSDAAALETFNADSALAAVITNFNGSAFFVDDAPPAGYTEAASGQLFVSTSDERRASFADANANHQMLYSRFHKSKYFCASCHDISNPVLANVGHDPADPLPTETTSAFQHTHVERTFSEFMLSDYGLQGGAAGLGPFAPSRFNTGQPNNVIASCQDCHMRDVVGQAAGQNRALIRPTESVEHPDSGVPQHDLTGGNLWVASVLASSVAGSPNYDPVNDQLINQGPATLTMDPAAGLGIDPVDLLAGEARARQMLQDAATITVDYYNPTSGELAFKVQNQTGHKLISGYPEGRRMFVNIKFYGQFGDILFEVNPYDDAAGTLKGLTDYTYSDPDGVLPTPAPLGPNEAYIDELVYEMHGSSSFTGEDETFHFVLSDGRYKDNRIPPLGFRISEASTRQSEPVWNGDSAPNYFGAAEYSGGYDTVALGNLEITVPDAVVVEIALLYQTTSREYIEFLRDEINGDASSLTLTDGKNPAGGDETYIIQTDPYFSQLAAWGDTIWQLWTHNKDVDGAAPVTMTQASWNSGGPTAMVGGDLSAAATTEPGQLFIIVAVLLFGTGVLMGVRRRRTV